MKKSIVISTLFICIFIFNGCSNSYNKELDNNKSNTPNSNEVNNIEKDNIDSVWLNNDILKITAKEAIKDNDKISISLEIENKYNDDFNIILENFRLGETNEEITFNETIKKGESKISYIQFKNKTNLSDLINKYEGVFLLKSINEDKEMKFDFLFKY